MMQNKLIITVTIILECFLLPVPTLLTTECPEDVQEMVPTRASSSTCQSLQALGGLCCSAALYNPWPRGQRRQQQHHCAKAGFCWWIVLCGVIYTQHKTQTMSQGAWSEPGLQSASNQELEVAMKGNHTCGRSPYTGPRCDPLGSWVSLGNI